MDRTLPLVVIGASTGGPGALSTILQGLSPPLECAIVIVQHIFPDGVVPLAKWLSDESGHRIEVANEGDRIDKGRILLASGQGHLRIDTRGYLLYSSTPQTVHMPSVDELFLSAAKCWTGPAMGVILTGMGNDGAAGLLALQKVSFQTVAQDENTSVVYGMPKAAIKLGAAASTLPLGAIAQSITQFSRTTHRKPSASSSGIQPNEFGAARSMRPRNG